MERWESYATRRVGVTQPIGLSQADVATWSQPAAAKERRLLAIRDLMRMEMPDDRADVDNGPLTFGTGTLQWSLPEPALHTIYRRKTWTRTTIPDCAKLLYWTISIGSPESMEQFDATEINFDSAGMPYFVDAWGNPILWLRTAPGYIPNPTVFAAQTTLPASGTIQTGDYTNDHDPFDQTGNSLYEKDFRLVPLIWSWGPNQEDGICAGPTNSDGTAKEPPQPDSQGKQDYMWLANPYYSWAPTDPKNSNYGKTMWRGSVLDKTAYDNITNHQTGTR
jgi:hypothetical protein